MALELSTKNYQLRELKTDIEVDFPLKLEPSIRRLSERVGFVKYKIENRCVTTNGGNYLGILYEINVKGRTKDGDKELYLFVKHAINDMSLNIISVSDVYATEMFAYKELAKIFTQLQDQGNVPLEERFKMIQVYEESNTEALIMENIGKMGFTSYYRMEVPSLKFFELAVIQLAKFHGLSFVLKELRPEYFSKNIKSLKTPFIFNDGWIEIVTNLKNASLKHVDDKFKDKVKKTYDDLLYKYSQYYTDESLKICLRHGDYRPCNIMIKLDEGEIQDLIPVDYQLLHYGCPVFDFLYLIFSGTDRQFRKAHLSYLKDLYHETLADFLTYFNLDINEVYPKQEFEKVYIEKLDFGLMTAMLLLPFVFASEHDVPDLSQSDIRFNLDAKVRDRFHGVIEDYIEWGFL